jgi:membrane protease YdiL (CAAX protease family)
MGEHEKDSNSNFKDIKTNALGYNFCPSCGQKLPQKENIRFCIYCGVDLNYVKEHKTLPPTHAAPTYAQYPVTQQYYGPYREILSDDEIISTKNRRLWGNLPSIGLPLLGFIVMNGLLLGIVIALFLIGSTVFFNPFFIVFSTLAELILILIPLWYVKRYLKNPTLDNRLTLLGFTIKGYQGTKLFREVIIGLIFAVVGLFLVAFSSLGIELLLRYVFGIRIIEESPSSDVEVLITGMDILVLILMVLMMLIIVGPCEEILFRGFMQRGLVRRLGEKWGIAITAIIFASIHLVGLFIYILNPLVFIILFIYLFAPYIAISLMLGLMFRWRNENLIAVVITHGVYNSLTLIIAFLFFAFY